MSFIKKYLFLALVMTLIQACKKDENKHPEIQTIEVKAAEPGKISISGIVVSRGSFNVVDYGFVYSSNSYFDENNAVKISLGKDIKEGEFSTESAIYLNGANYYQNQIIYVKAYLVNDKGTVYGETKSVQLPYPSASNLVPNSGKSGDIIEIFGQFFVNNVNQVKVSFGNVNAKIVSATSTKLTVEVPTGITTQSYYSSGVNVRIFINNAAITSDYIFQLTPTLKDFNPKTGYAGTTVSISGENFSTYNNTFRVFFDNVEVNHSTINATEIRVVVPSNLPSAKANISVLVNGVKTNLSGDFTLLTPVISSINPIQGIPGTNVTISGTNLPSYNYNLTGNTLSVGNVNTSFSLNNSTTLNFNIPAGLEEGEHVIKLKTGPFEIESPVKFKVVYPNIQSFTPSSGGAGEEITLTGTFFANTTSSVYIGGQYASIKSTSANTMVVYVPSGITPGKVKVSITSGGKANIASGDFTFIGPTISSFSPKTGIAGDIVTIRGTGFNTYFSYNTVRFGSINAQVLSSTATEIKAVIPSNLLPAEMKITVIANGQTIVSNDNFTSK